MCSSDLIDVCGHCLGVWLDPGELEKLSGQSAPRVPETLLPAVAVAPVAASQSRPGMAQTVNDTASTVGDVVDAVVFVGEAIGSLLDF